jgi:ATP phosphoribosyltransferase regulatory subunit
VGSHADLADGEVIALAVEIARTLNFNKFQLRLGHNGIFSGLARELKFDEELRRQLEDEISRKNMVKLERTIEQSSLSADVKELLFSMPHLTGGEEVLDKLQTWGHIEAIAEAAESLRNIFRYLQHFGVKKEVTVDLGILRGFSYYTGVIFEGYLPGIGIPILEGGRYDRLYADFGLNHPATGWAMNLGLISEYQAGPEKEATMILVYGESVEKVIKHCRELRESGHQVEMALEDLTPQEAEQLAKEKGLKHVVRVEKDERKKVCLDKS